jgi:hypothetical protein
MSGSNPDGNERRSGSIEAILVHIGEVKGISAATERKLDSLNEKVSFQNGRIGKIEINEAEKKGYFKALSILIWVLTGVIVPMGLIVFQLSLKMKYGM